MSDKTDNRFYREAGTEDWRVAFDERHEFDVYPDHFMSGMRNEFCAGWQAALKSKVSSQPKELTDHHRDVLGRLAMLLEACQVENGIDHARSLTYAEALNALLETTK